MSSKTSLFLFAAVLLCCAVFAHGQVSPFMALGNAQFFDNNGQLLTSGVLYSYQAGTTTQQATYTDYTGLSVNPNPIPFGSGARVSIWLTSTSFYKFVLCQQNDGASCAPAHVLFSVDQVPGCPGCSTGGSTFTGTFISGSPNPATTGILELATTDAVCWRNTAGTANLCITKNASDTLSWPGIFTAPTFLSACSPGAASAGTLRLCTGDAIGWRNNANSADVLLSKSATDNLVWPNGLSLGGGTPLANTNQSGTGNLCLVTNCLLITPALNGVVITGTPGAGNCLIATSTTAASWSNCAAVQASSITLLGSGVVISGTTTVLTKNVTMPAAGCPCRAFVSYTINFDGTNSGLASATVNDGSNNFATGSMNTTGSTTDFAIQASSFSTGTYANSASVTFTLKAATTMAGTTNAHTGNANGLGQVTNLNVAILTSN